MNVNLVDGPVVVTLSRRNLTDLVAALDAGHAAPGIGLVRACKNGVVLHVIPEEDSVHYATRAPGPGFGYADAPEDAEEDPEDLSAA